MLIPYSTLKDFRLTASDGEAGEARDIYFTNREWTICYLIGRIGSWFSNRSVLISVYFLAEHDLAEKKLSVSLTKRQIRHLPLRGSKKMVSEHEEMNQSHELEMPPRSPGLLATKEAFYTTQAEKRTCGAHGYGRNQLLYSCEELLINHTLRVNGRTIGCVADFIVDADAWRLRYFVVRTRLLPSGRPLLLPANFVREISFAPREVIATLGPSIIKDPPKFQPSVLKDPCGDGHIHAHRRRQTSPGAIE